MKHEIEYTSTYNQELADSVIKNGLILRGTVAWDNRERLRQQNGAGMLSYGGINQSLASNGASSLYPPY